MQKTRRIRARVPATTSNLGPGFDVLGLALKLYNEIELHVLPSEGPVSVEVAGEGSGTLPTDERNEVVRAARLGLPKSRIKNALHFKLTNRIPIARGLGSSAAARLGGLLVMRAFLGPKPDFSKILPLAHGMEGHPDNVTPALYGGFHACFREGSWVRSVRLPFPRTLRIAVAVPDYELSTVKARSVLPEKVPREDAVHNASRMALLLGGLLTGRLDWLKTGMEDRLHQPYRTPLVRGMRGVIEAALSAGALGAALSGAGPSVIALAEGEALAAAAARAMQRAFQRFEVECRYLVLEPDEKGAAVEEL